MLFIFLFIFNMPTNRKKILWLLIELLLSKSWTDPAIFKFFTSSKIALALVEFQWEIKVSEPPNLA